MCLFSPPRSALTVFISLGGVIFAYITRTWDSVKDFWIVTEVDPPLGIPVSHLKYPSWISTLIMIWEIEIHIQIHWDDSVLSNYQVCIPYSIVANLILVCDRKPIVRIHFFCIANYQCWKLNLREHCNLSETIFTKRKSKRTMLLREATSCFWKQRPSPGQTKQKSPVT